MKRLLAAATASIALALAYRRWLRAWVLNWGPPPYPWPLAAEFGPGPEAAWGPPEVLAHVTEMLPYWLGVMER